MKQPNVNNPRHQQIAEWVRDKIDSGYIMPDEQIPSENELSRMFDVSRVTVRHALATLEYENVIYKRQGLGSFASAVRVRQQLHQLSDFREDLSNAGIDASSELIDFAPVYESPAHQVLGIETDKPVMKLERIRLGNGRPYAVDQTWLPMIYGQLLDPEKLQDRTIFDILETDFDIPILEGRYKFEAVLAGDQLSSQLNISKSDPLMLVHRCAKTIGGKMVYYQHRYLRNDLLTYEIVLEREQNTGSKEGLTFKSLSTVVAG